MRALAAACLLFLVVLGAWWSADHWAADRLGPRAPTPPPERRFAVRVLSSGGAPAVGIDLLLRWSDAPEAAPPLARGRSDASGGAELVVPGVRWRVPADGAPPRLQLEALHPAPTPVRLELVGDPAVPDAPPAAPAELRLPPAAEVELRLTEADGTRPREELVLRLAWRPAEGGPRREAASALPVVDGRVGFLASPGMVLEFRARRASGSGDWPLDPAPGPVTAAERLVLERRLPARR